MTTAVDTSVVLDVLSADGTFGEASREALRAAYDAGALVACDVVWAELRAHFDSESAFAAATSALGVGFDPVDATAAALAGRLWRDRRRAGAGRDRLVADFLVGAHALTRGVPLLTRDRGFYRSSFRGLKVVDPSDRTRRRSPA